MKRIEGIFSFLAGSFYFSNEYLEGEHPVCFLKKTDKYAGEENPIIDEISEILYPSFSSLRISFTRKEAKYVIGPSPV